MIHIALLLPTYNEKANIGTLISAIEGVFEKLNQYKLTIVVIDDHSPDGTAEIVTKHATKYRNIILLAKEKEGLGAAIAFGMRYAIKELNPEILIQMDADWSHNPLLLPDFLKAYENGADFVIGSRYIKGGSIPGNWGLHRKIYSITGNMIVRLGLGQLSPHDWTSGFRLMKMDVFKKIEKGLEKYTGYTFQVASLHRVKQAGFTIYEVPLQFIDRVHGKSKIAPSEYIKNVLLYVFNNSTLLKYLIIGTIGFSVQGLAAKLLVQLGMFEGLSVGVGSFLAIVTNFLGNNLWTFSHKRIHGARNLFKKFVHFCTTSLGALFIQVAVVSLGVIVFGSQAWFWLMVFAIVFLVIPYNFFIYNKFIWKNNKNI